MSTSVRILFLGDIVGNKARDFIKQVLPAFIQKEKIFFTVANAENSAGGSGITPRTVHGLFEAGIDVVTSGDHIWKKPEVLEIINTEPIVRPLNYGAEAAGRGFLIKEKNGVKIAAVNLIGRVFMQAVDCPFKSIRDSLPEISRQTNLIIVDVHAEATSEKLALGYFLAGKVSAIFGTHTHIPTADERIIQQHTAYITDVGMCGPFDSILGRVKENVIERFVTNMGVRFNLAENDLRLQGAIVDVDSVTGKSSAIRRIEIREDKVLIAEAVSG